MRSMRLMGLKLLAGLGLVLINPGAQEQVWAQSDDLGSPCTLSVELTGTVGPATLDLFERAMVRASEQKCDSLLLLINTPGGSLLTTRIMVEKILNSSIPILCLVSPSGGHAGSAGAIILAACHVNGAMVATNLGAATPILATGQEIPEDLRKKMLNDTRSWMEGITRLRGRSEKFGQDIILEAKAVSADEAKKLGAIDVVVTRIEEFLRFAKGRTVKLSENQTTLVKVGPLSRFAPDARYRVLDLLTDPQLAYLLLMGSLALIYFEITNPGTLVAGVFGGIGLVISLIALHKLNVEWGGLALMLLGIGLLIAEAFVPSFGILGIGGIASFVIGSLFLFDPASGYQLPLKLILPTAVLIGAVMLAVGVMLLKSRRVKKRGGYDDLLDELAQVVEVDATSPRAGMVEVRGELWRVESNVDLVRGAKVRIDGYQGMTLKVSPV